MLLQFTDVSRLLNNYQLWLDDLFPKANFVDGLAIIEKLGHKKRLQVMRKEWIDEGKPRPASPDLSDREEESNHERRQETGNEDQNGSRAEPANDTLQAQVSRNDERDAMDEDLYAEPTPPRDEVGGQRGSLRTDNAGHAEEPDLDELDELLAEDAARNTDGRGGGPPIPVPSARDQFADEEEAMAGMEDW